MENRIFDLADQLKAAKDKKKELDAESKELGAKIEELDLALSDAMADAECEHFSRNGSTFYLNTRLYASPIAGQKEAMFQALKENGYQIRDIRKKEFHLLSTASVDAIFQAVIHDFSKKEAMHYAETLEEFFEPAWKALFGL